MNQGFSLSGGAGPSRAGSGMNGTGFYKEKVPKGYSQGKLQQFSPEQLDLFQQLFGHVGPESYLSRLAAGDQSIFNEIESPALQQFSGLQGNIASRFSGMGGTGARRSSGFQNTMNAAASDFAQQLQSQRQNLQRQAIMDLMGISSNLLGQRPYENTLTKKSTDASGWGSALGGVLGAGVGGAAGFMTGNPWLGIAGAKVGSDAFSGF